MNKDALNNWAKLVSVLFDDAAVFIFRKCFYQLSWDNIIETVTLLIRFSLLKLN